LRVKRNGIKRNGRKYIKRSFMFYTAQPKFVVDKIGKNEMCGACRAYGGGESIILGSGGESSFKDITGEKQP